MLASGPTATPCPASSPVPQCFCQTRVPSGANFRTKTPPPPKLLVPPLTYTEPSAPTATAWAWSLPLPPHLFCHSSVPSGENFNSTASPATPTVNPVTYSDPSEATATSFASSSPNVSGPAQVLCQATEASAANLTVKILGRAAGSKLVVNPAR